MIEPLPRGRNPFDETGVVRDEAGLAHYRDRPASLVAMLQASVDRDAAATALLEVGGASLSYGELWERAARVAGGLREAGVERGDRVAIRLRQRDRLGARVLRRAAARARWSCR